MKRKIKVRGKLVVVHEKVSCRCGKNFYNLTRNDVVLCVRKTNSGNLLCLTKFGFSEIFSYDLLSFDFIGLNG